MIWIPIPTQQLIVKAPREFYYYFYKYLINPGIKHQTSKLLLLFELPLLVVGIIIILWTPK